MDALKYLSLAFAIANALASSAEAVDDFNARMDVAKPGDEVAFDIPDDHEPRWPGHLHGGHTGDVSKILIRKRG